ncbi:MAG: glycosyltransferase family 4 protein [Armatimonadota bacterium]|nr:glycosyltransferase family 4 protein [Armatimonadota bacterium]
MRILMVNKFYHEAGGAERYMLSLSALLERAGHEVIPFAMQDTRNMPTPYARWFSPHVRVRGPLPLRERFWTAVRVVYSADAAKAVARLVRHVRPEVAHVHNIYHHLSPSVLVALKDLGVPVVHTMHDLKLICANYSLFTRGAICERCKGNRHFHAVVQRCCKGGLGASLVGAVEMYLHGALKTYARTVDAFVSPSRFLRDKLAEFGMDVRRVRHIPNFVDVDAFSPRYGPSDGYVVYVGRVTFDKGVGVLVQAMADLPQLMAYVVGDGDARGPLQEQCARKGIRNVRFLGPRPHRELPALVGGAAVVVLPSLLYDNCPLVVLEAFAMGKPVIGSRLGGIPELIADGDDGMLVAAGDPAALRDAIAWLMARPQTIEAMGRNGRAKVERLYGPDTHLQAIGAVYDEVRGVA